MKQLVFEKLWGNYSSRELILGILVPLLPMLGLWKDSPYPAQFMVLLLEV